MSYLPSSVLGTPQKNYLLNGSFAISGTASSWSVFKTTLTNQIPTGSISAADVGFSITPTSTTPLSGSYSGLLASTGVLAVGNGLISDTFTIDREDQAKVMSFSFYYESVSGTQVFAGTSANTWAVYIYAVDGTSGWIQPTGVYNLTQGSGIGLASGTFQTTSDSTQYRIAIVCVTATSGAISLKVDDFRLGPQTVVYGAPVTDWQTISGFTLAASGGSPTVLGSNYRRVGDSYEFQIDVKFTASASVNEVSFIFPSSIRIDTAKEIDAASRTSCGSGLYRNYDSGGLVVGDVHYSTSVAGSDRVVFYMPSQSVANNHTIGATFRIPVVGLSSTVQMSNDTDTRVVAARAGRAANDQTINTNNSGQKIEFFSVSGGVNFDTHSVFISTSYRYVAPVSGFYNISANLTFKSTNVLNNRYFAYIWKNGTTSVIRGPEVRPSAATEFATPVNGSLYLSAGEYIEVYIYGVGNNSLSGYVLDGANEVSYLSVNRLSGPATIAASETVAARVTSTIGQLLTTSDATISFNNRVFDTHGAMNTGTYNYIVPVSGIYKVSCKGGSQLTTTGVRDISVCVVIDGSIVSRQTAFKPATTASFRIEAAATWIGELNAGQAITGTARGIDTTYALATTGTQTALEIERIG